MGLKSRSIMNIKDAIDRLRNVNLRRRQSLFSSSNLKKALKRRSLVSVHTSDFIKTTVKRNYIIACTTSHQVCLFC